MSSRNIPSDKVSLVTSSNMSTAPFRLLFLLYPSHPRNPWPPFDSYRIARLYSPVIFIHQLVDYEIVGVRNFSRINEIRLPQHVSFFFFFSIKTTDGAPSQYRYSYHLFFFPFFVTLSVPALSFRFLSRVTSIAFRFERS